MCGICGILNFDAHEPVAALEVRGMAASIAHRGPDDDGFYVRGNVGLGMRRLSVIDVAEGRQPMTNEDGTLHVVYNGEIYNYRELRRELASSGHRFRSHSDTEVIVHAYEEWGRSFVERLNGMFAFALWDERQRALLIARDRLGIKPLYYYADHKRLAFGSELRVLLASDYLERRIDPRALDCLLTLEYVPAPLTILQGVQKLPAGCLLTVTSNGVACERYWDLPRDTTASGSPADMEEALVERLRQAVRRQLVSDVPLGAFLSGGLDSSLVVALMREATSGPVKTFSIGFPAAGYDERRQARLVARHLGTDHYEYTVDPGNRDLVRRAIRSLDEPLADDSIVPTLLVSEAARRHVTVALSGDGGDELFAGYDSYKADRAAAIYARLPAPVRRRLIEPLLARLSQRSRRMGAINALKGLVRGLEKPSGLEHARWLTYLTPPQRARLYVPEFGQMLDGHDSYEILSRRLRSGSVRDRLARQLHTDLTTYLPDDVLAKVDRMSMAVSLEARPPLLDHELVEFVATIPSGLKLRRFQSKYILKRVAGRFLPAAIIHRRKSGFTMPLKNWLRGELKPLLQDVIESGALHRCGRFFDDRYIRQMMAEHDAMRVNHSHTLWSLIVFGLWSEQHLGSAPRVRARSGQSTESVELAHG
jgi:asparagine synthase (glutamine-hydrolysing)